MAWVQNGYGAGTDNSVVGGAGGFMAYPQPPLPTGQYTTPETNGQFGSLNFTYDNNMGNRFVIVNPGRNG